MSAEPFAGSGDTRERARPRRDGTHTLGPGTWRGKRLRPSRTLPLTCVGRAQPTERHRLREGKPEAQSTALRRIAVEGVSPTTTRGQSTVGSGVCREPAHREEGRMVLSATGR